MIHIYSCIFSFINSVVIWHKVKCSNLSTSFDSYLISISFKLQLNTGMSSPWFLFFVWHPVWSLQHGRQSCCIEWEPATVYRTAAVINLALTRPIANETHLATILKIVMDIHADKYQPKIRFFKFNFFKSPKKTYKYMW